MGVMDKIIIHHSTAYDFLAGMYRLNNNEKLIAAKEELELGEKVKFNEDILNWVKASRMNLPQEIKDGLDLFFNYESFFGICLMNDIADKDIKNAVGFISHIEKLSYASILSSFLETGYNSDELTIEQVEEMLGSHKEAISFIEKTITLPSKQKWELLQFFLDPEGMRNRFLELLRWYNANIFMHAEKNAEAVVLKQEKELEKKLGVYGESYLKLLVDIDYSKSKERRLVIALSYYYEVSNLRSIRECKGVDLHLLGYRYPELIAEGKHALLSNVSIFKALADETRLNIIKLLSERPWYGNELAQKLKLSNSTISYHMSMLTMNGLVETVREDNKYYFSLNMDNVKKTLCDALDNMVK
ncbi:MAG TPA: metalloregulator ArsR/SmtB family transcription factor [Clostridia bacterium]|nr:metalloregulator ArsR/SmtB family transcription factor [Clostridia bacterium]